ncbi:MAG TPA: STAS domain-containing protein, partial [Pseudonocardiaceae bacterium]
RGALLDQLPGAGPITLDLRSLTYLSSAGIGMLLNAAQHAAIHDIPLQLQLTSCSIAARILALTGLDTTLAGTTDSTG